MYFVYMLRCTDNSIYTGSASDLDKRMALHFEGKGAKYTKSHPPKKLEAAFECEEYRSALKLEYHIKRLSKQEKQRLIDGDKIETLIGDKVDASLYKRL